MYKVEDIYREMFEMGMISKEEYAELICEHRNNELSADIEEQFEVFSNECEKYADDVMANYIVLTISGNIEIKEMLQKMIKLYENKLKIDIELGSIPSEDVERRKLAHGIMIRSLHCFKIE